MPAPPQKRLPADERPRTGRGVAARTVRVALVLLVPLVLLELTLRIAGPHVPGVATLLFFPKRVHRYDHAQNLEQLFDLTVLGWQPRARCIDFVLNSRSLRTREYDEGKRPGTLRIVALGDSFTFAVGVPYEKSWPVVLESRLQKHSSAPVEVLNFGVPAVGTEFEQRLWELEGSKLGADLVVLAFPVGSNFHSSNKGRRQRTFSDQIAWYSCAYRVARNALRLNAAVPREELEGQWTRRGPSPDGAVGVRIAEVQPDFQTPLRMGQPALSEEAFERLQQGYLPTCAGIGMQQLFEYSGAALVELRDAVEASGAELLVMICPAELQVSPSLLAGVAERSALPDAPDSFEEVEAAQRFLREFLAREGIRYLDLLPAFRAGGDRCRFYGVRDSHWNVAGNALAASELARFLLEERAQDPSASWTAHLQRNAGGARSRADAATAPSDDGRR